jgi:hypothetical protein
MLEARIESPRGSLYYAAEATPYDLEMLRLYVRDLTPPTSRLGDLRMEVAVDDADPAAPVVQHWLHQLAASGVRVLRARGTLANKRSADR